VPTPQQIAEAGPWAVLAFVLIAVIFGAATAFVRGWVVPGWVYRRLDERSDRTEVALAKLTTSIDTLADDIAWDSRDRNQARPARRPGARSAE